MLKSGTNRERDRRLISCNERSDINRNRIISIIPRMMVKSDREGLMITEMNEKDFNKKSLKTLNHNINTYRVPLVTSLRF